MKHIVIILIIAMLAVVGFAKDEVDPVVDTESWTHNGSTFNVKKSKKVKCWRYVHDGTTLLCVPFESNGYTYTKLKLVTSKSWEKCRGKLKLENPKLIISDEQMVEINRIDMEQEALFGCGNGIATGNSPRRSSWQRKKDHAAGHQE